METTIGFVEQEIAVVLVAVDKAVVSETQVVVGVEVLRSGSVAAVHLAPVEAATRACPTTPHTLDERSFWPCPQWLPFFLPRWVSASTTGESQSRLLEQLGEGHGGGLIGFGRHDEVQQLLGHLFFSKNW